MPRKTNVKKFDNVEIQFVNLEDADSLNATVLLRGEEMVIDMQDDDGVTAYLIIGKPVDYFFKGVNSAGKTMPKVLASWVKLGSTYVGVWIQDAREYLFSFELNS